MATRERVAWGAAAIALLAFAAVFVVTRGRTTGQPAEDLPTYSASILIPDNLRLWSGNPPGRFALSPDGRLLALVASDASGHVMLWIRPLDTKVPYPLAGTDGASFPFWSADSRFIAFLADRKLKKIQASGGDVVTLCDAAFGSTGTWSRDDVILFTPGGNSPLFRVSASSGVPTQVTALHASSGDVQHSYPSFLPDGRHFLYFVVGSKTGGLTDPRGVYGGSLDSNQPGKLVLEGGSNAKYANGHLIFLREGTLLAQLFDIDRLELRGEPIPLVEQVQVTGAATTGTAGGFSVSQTGLLVYQTGISARSQLAWYDRTGVQLSTLGDRADYGDVALSPDGSRLAVSVMDPPLGTRDLWIFEVARGLRERFSFDPGDDFGPNWSRPDGTRIAFSSRRHGGIQLYEKPAGGSGSERVVLNDALGKFNPVFSPDGSYLLYVAGGGIIARSDLWALPLSGGGKPAPFLDRPFVETQGQFSPDGRWVAYASNESGSLEVNVTPFPGRGDRFQVSTAGGSWPRWNQSGKEIFYLAPDNTLTAVPVRVEGSRFDVGAPRPLFVMHPRPMVRLDAFPYDVTPDGQRFLVNTFVDEPTSTAITLVVNWMNVRRR